MFPYRPEPEWTIWPGFARLFVVSFLYILVVLGIVALTIENQQATSNPGTQTGQ